MTLFSRRFRLPLILLIPVLFALGIAGCGSEDDATATTALTTSTTALTTSTTALTTATNATDPDAEYCAAMRQMAVSQPAGSLTDAELEAGMNAYADAVERVAELSPEDEAATLRELADVMRAAGLDPTAPGLAERVGSLAGPVAAITLPAARDCGIDFDELTG